MSVIDNLGKISHLTDSAKFETGIVNRLLIADGMSDSPSSPLLFDDDVFYASRNERVKWEKWHNPTNIKQCEILPLSVYFLENCLMTIFGVSFWEGAMIQSPDIMMNFSRNRLHFLPLSATESLPIRDIDTPCVCWMGWGTQTYGHLIVEMLPRLILLRETVFNALPNHKYLVDIQAPKWFLNIILDDIKISIENIEFFDSKIERVNVKNCILVSQVMNKIIHPLAKDVYRRMYNNISPIWDGISLKKIFLTRSFLNDGLRGEVCSNENNLARIASREFGFSIIAPETFPFKEQAKIFARSEIISGVCGSALHTAIFSKPGTKIGGISPNNRLQSNIANLLGHKIAFTSFEENEKNYINENVFRFFLERLLDPQKSPDSMKYYLSKKDRSQMDFSKEIFRSRTIEGNFPPISELVYGKRDVLNIISHKRNIGNVCTKNVSATGEYTDNDIIEAISFVVPEALDLIIECKFRSEGENEWSDWIESPEWVGIKGEHKSLNGIEIRVKSDNKKNISITYFVKFHGEEEITIIYDKDISGVYDGRGIVYIGLIITENIS
ncbi:DUF563 domain-containing protein [Gluconobacter cerinus]|uniref:glycosyltransferase family 61 protein n=1 Tax=Gluconobacter cerinus TaxID=38307 RepID=UPI00194006E4|nr:glycosyltransferase family 61 protein [Gluconobacter cerinus]MBM3099344.1 DUF563 domain-containing protein [Gluconobacter cerinus]